MTLIKIFQEFYNDHIDPDGIQPIHAFRTTAAGILAILLYHAFSWPQAYWILVSTVLIIQTYNAPTPKQRWIFLIITGLLATAFTFIASLLGQTPILLALFFATSTFITVYLNIISSDVGNAAFYVNLFCLSSGALPLNLIDTFHRTTSVFLGFLIAVIVCACLWPERLNSIIRSIISQNLFRLSELNSVLSERTKNEKAIVVRRNRLMRGFQSARRTIPVEEIQSWQIIHQIEYLYEIILGLDEIKEMVENQRALFILSRRLTLLLRKLGHAVKENSPPPEISKFLHSLHRLLKSQQFNEERVLAFSVYIDTLHKLEKRMISLITLSKKMGYRA
jgi:uncharacterized membrane protein YccC